MPPNMPATMLALPACLAVLVADGLGRFVHQLGGEQALDEPHQREGQRVRQDDTQRLKRERDGRPRQVRQATGQRAQVTHRAHLPAEGPREPGEHDDGHQRGRDDLGDARQQVDDAEACGDHDVGRHARALELRELGHQDEDGERVHEARHDGAGHKAHVAREAQIAEDDLDDAREQRGGQQVRQAVLAHEGHHHQRHGARRG
jgi:hypothetical protein